MVAEQTANTVDYDPVEILIPRGRGKEQGTSSLVKACQLASPGWVGKWTNPEQDDINEILVAEMINHYATLKKMVIGSIMNKKEKLCNEFNDALGPVPEFLMLI